MSIIRKLKDNKHLHIAEDKHSVNASVTEASSADFCKGGMKRRRHICAGVLAASLVLVSAFGMHTDSFAAYGEQEINASKQKIEDNKAKLKELKSESDNVDAKIDELNKLKSDAAEYIAKLDAELTKKQSEIDELGRQVTELESNIQVTQGELAEAESEQDKQYASMKTRIKFMYEHSNDSILDVLFGSQSFSDVINKVEYIRNVSEYDRDKLNEFVELKEAAEAKKAELESEKEVLEQTKAKSESEKSSIEKLQNDKTKEIDSYNSRIAAGQAELADMQEDMAGIQKAIQAEENNIASIEAKIKQQEEEARKKAEASGTSYVTKTVGDISFTWPCPSSGRVSSGFGARSSPTEGASSNHKGIDIGASTGASVVAAADGTVVIATYSASAGNYVMLSHGGGVYTVYMHMSSIAVSSGQTVSKGSTIGAVGSTGYSTGPHLHFGIRINGSYVNPLGYVSP